MLLSFPLDPDPSVVEIISDSVYANWIYSQPFSLNWVMMSLVVSSIFRYLMPSRLRDLALSYLSGYLALERSADGLPAGRVLSMLCPTFTGRGRSEDAQNRSSIESSGISHPILAIHMGLSSR